MTKKPSRKTTAKRKPAKKRVEAAQKAPTKQTLTVMTKLLTVLREGGSIGKACEAAGISRTAYVNWCKRDEEFADVARDAIERGTDRLEDEAYRRAHDGVEKPVFYQGEVCGTVQEYSDGLMQILLGARRPEKYRQKIQVDASIDGDAISAAAEEAKRKLLAAFGKK